MEKSLRRLLEIKGLTQKDLAEQLYVTPQAVSKWIGGQSRPSYDNVIRIYELYGFDLTKEVSRKTSHCRGTNMSAVELKELDSFEKAKEEAIRLIDKAGIKRNYSHSVNVLVSWLLPAVIGLTFHQLLHSSEEDEINYDNIGCNLKDYFDEEFPHKRNGLYENYLEYNFYLMGMDLFESFGEYKLMNHDYCEKAMDSWYKFSSAVTKSPSSQIYCELRVAISELAAFLE